MAFLHKFSVLNSDSGEFHQFCKCLFYPLSDQYDYGFGKQYMWF